VTDRTERMTAAEYLELIGEKPRKRSAPKAPAVREEHMQARLEQYLTLHGWVWFHDRATNHAHLNRPGFPDVVAVHPNGAGPVFIELKGSSGVVSEAQQLWADALVEAGALYRLVWPDDEAGLFSWLDALRIERSTRS